MDMIKLNYLESCLADVRRVRNEFEDKSYSYTSQPAWDAMDNPMIIKMCNNENVFQKSQDMKPFLREMFKKIIDEMIKDYERRIKAMKVDDESSRKA